MEILGKISEIVKAVFRGTLRTVTIDPDAGNESLSTDLTLKIPDTGGATETEIITQIGTQTISSKTLDNSNSATFVDTNLTIEDDGDLTKKVKFDATGVLPSTTATFQTPNASDTLVGVAASQSLLNKTITDATNDLSADRLTSGTVPDARISSGSVTQHTGDIDHDSLTNFVANEHIDWTTNAGVDIADANIASTSVTQHEASITHDSTSGGTATVAHGATGAVVGTTNTQTLESKTLDASTVGGATNDGTDGFVLFKDQSSDPSATNGNDVKLFAKDKALWFTDNTGVAQEVGSGSGGGEINYIENPDAETDTSGWTTTGTGTIARSTTAGEILRGAASFRLSASAAAGTVEYIFTLPEADENKLLKIEFDVKALAGYASGEWEVSIENPSAATITPNNTSVIASQGLFQASWLSEEAGLYKLIFTSTADTGTGIAIDNVVVGPGVGLLIPQHLDQQQ
jgi:hypothetical protein